MELRCYHFGNMYMSSIQQGIQAAHAQMAMFVKYDKAEAVKLHTVIGETHITPDERLFVDSTKMLYEWGEKHQTMICLNGGYLENMKAIAAHLTHSDNPFPWSTFHESQEAMGGMLTNIAIVLPDYIYNTASWLRNPRNELQTYDGDPGFYLPSDAQIDYHDVEFTWWEKEFMYMLNKCGLAK